MHSISIASCIAVLSLMIIPSTVRSQSTATLPACNAATPNAYLSIGTDTVNLLVYPESSYTSASSCPSSGTAISNTTIPLSATCTAVTKTESYSITYMQPSCWSSAALLITNCTSSNSTSAYNTPYIINPADNLVDFDLVTQSCAGHLFMTDSNVTLYYVIEFPEIAKTVSAAQKANETSASTSSTKTSSGNTINLVSSIGLVCTAVLMAVI